MSNNRQKLSNYLQTESGKKQLDKYAPDGVTEGEVKRIALWVVEEGADALDRCTPGSIVAGVLQSLHEDLDITPRKDVDEEAELRQMVERMDELHDKAEGEGLTHAERQERDLLRDRYRAVKGVASE